MKFTETPLKGAFVIDLESHVDDRGFFARIFSAQDFAARGLDGNLTQGNISHNNEIGTLRGLHFQKAPHAETKLVRCTAGRIFEVVVDLREQSATRGKTFSLELSQENRRALYIPKGFAHGFQSLAPNTDVLYHMTDDYAPDFATGIRWNDPSLRIAWPIENPILSAKDSTLPFYS